jgi:mRNA-degrading endonuclease RelE of RelBE toxin-antitoxin system
MNWTVTFSSKARKQIQKLPTSVQDSLAALVADIQTTGPVRGDWPNYSKLSGTEHHCHIKKGRPTYVVIWEEKDRQIKLVEVTYAGTHEKAPY